MTIPSHVIWVVIIGMVVIAILMIEKLRNFCALLLVIAICIYLGRNL